MTSELSILPTPEEFILTSALAVAVFEAFFGAHPRVVSTERAIGRFLLRTPRFVPWEAYFKAARVAMRRGVRNHREEQITRAEEAHRSSYFIDTLELTLGGVLTLAVALPLVAQRFGVQGADVTVAPLVSASLLAVFILAVVPRRILVLRARARLGGLKRQPAREVLALYAPVPTGAALLSLTARSLPGVAAECVLGSLLVPLQLLLWCLLLPASLSLLFFSVLALLLYSLIFYPSSWLTKLSARRMPGLRTSPIAILLFWLTIVGAVVHFWPI